MNPLVTYSSCSYDVSIEDSCEHWQIFIAKKRGSEETVSRVSQQGKVIKSYLICKVFSSVSKPNDYYYLEN